MVNSVTLDYGQCPCGGYYENRWVEVRMTVKGQSLKISDVPQGACPVCGSRVYKAEILERMEATLKGEPRDGRLNRSPT